MKYDLKRLKETIDERIPTLSPDESILDRALEKGAKHNSRYLSRALTAMAACVILFAVMSVLVGPGLETRPDDTGDGSRLLSEGIHSQPTEAPQTKPREESEEDLSAYQVYGPDYAISALPDEKEFGDVVIRKLDNYDQTFVFEDKETGEQVIPGQFDMAFAWFPATETGLIREAGSEGLSLVSVLRETLDGEYSYFEYKGNGVAIVANRDEDETEPDPMYLISTADGTRLSRDYTTIGTMRSGEFLLMLGHDDQDLLGDFDVLAMDGRVIAQVSELSGVYFEEWLCVQLPGENEYCLIDVQGEVQLNGLRFSRVAYEKDSMMIVWTDDGSGVIRKDGSWVFEPGRYFMIEFVGGGLFRAVDLETGETVQINEAGERVDTLSFRLYRMKEGIGRFFDLWRMDIGQLGFAIMCMTALWLILRIGWTRSEGELPYMLMTELGFAVYIAGLILIGHKLGENVTLWPTDASTEGAGALAGQWTAAAFALTASLIAIFPRLRRPKQAFLAGYALMLLPWGVKAACGDMSVMQWRAMSDVVFAGGALLAVLLFLAKPVKRFLSWCARFDSLNEYGKAAKGAWLVLSALAMVNFTVGCMASGQELVKVTHHAEYEIGQTEEMNADWFDEVGALYEAYRESGWDDDCLDLEKYDYTVVSSVRWLRENGISELTEDMLYTVRMTGEVELRRQADVQLVVEAAEQDYGNVWQIAADTPLAGAVGPMEGSAVFLVAPGEGLPDIRARLYIRQSMDLGEFIAAQRFYRADLGVVLTAEEGSENGIAPAAGS